MSLLISDLYFLAFADRDFGSSVVASVVLISVFLFSSFASSSFFTASCLFASVEVCAEDSVLFLSIVYKALDGSYEETIIKEQLRKAYSKAIKEI